MNRHYNYKFQKDMVVIGPGERFTTKEDILISTILGSCVSVSCFDTRQGFGGINHFMLTGEGLNSYSMGITGNYGVHALELLFDDMHKLGARFRDLEVKVFGGGAVLNLSGEGSDRVPKENIQFAFRILKEKYKLPVSASDVGGSFGRKVLFFPTSGKVMVKQLNRGLISPVLREELQIIQELRSDQK